MQAAQRQGKGFEMADKIFANMKALTDDDLRQATRRELGLDAGKFKDRLRQPVQVKDEVANDSPAGKAVPRVFAARRSIFVNGKRFTGAAHARRVQAGHRRGDQAAADELIKAVARSLRQSLRDTRSKANAGAK
jgi:hypothetical protein